MVRLHRIIANAAIIGNGYLVKDVTAIKAAVANGLALREIYFT